jgi:hypothetical protein
VEDGLAAPTQQALDLLEEAYDINLDNLVRNRITTVSSQLLKM